MRVSRQNGSTHFHGVYPKRSNGSLMSKKNDKSEELTMMLNIIHDTLTSGKNGWAAAPDVYETWARHAGYKMQDSMIMKQEFDGMASERKPTGVGQCLSSIRMAKRIAHGIQPRSSAGSLGIEPGFDGAIVTEHVSTGQSDETTMRARSESICETTFIGGYKMV